MAVGAGAAFAGNVIGQLINNGGRAECVSLGMALQAAGYGAGAGGGYGLLRAIFLRAWASLAARRAALANSEPNRIYSARELMRRAGERGPFHNFPESFNKTIFEQGTRTVKPNFFKNAKPGLTKNGAMYRLEGSINGRSGTFEIGVRPSISGNTEVITHRFFRPNP